MQVRQSDSKATVAWDKSWRLWVVYCPKCGPQDGYPEHEDAQDEAHNHRCEDGA